MLFAALSEHTGQNNSCLKGYIPNLHHNPSHPVPWGDTLQICASGGSTWTS